MIKVLLYLTTFIFITGCFSEESSSGSGGGLFSGNKPVTNVISINHTPSGVYNESDTLQFLMSHPFAMSATGTPQIEIDLGGSTVFADLVSGNGTNVFLFEYTILTGDDDTDGIEIVSVNPNGDLTFSNGNVDLTLPSLNTAGIIVASTPAVEINTPSDLSVVNIANNTTTYAVSGTCNQTAETVNLTINSIPVTGASGLVCDGNNFSGSFDISSVADGALALEADLLGTTSSIINITKDTIAPNLAITSSPDIDGLNVGSYALSGTCDENGATVNIDLGALSNSANCDGANWSVTNWDVSSLSDNASISLSVDYTDTVLNPASDTVSIAKSTSVYSISITAASAINIANVAAYNISGTCSNDTENVTLDIASATLTDTVACSSGSFNFTIDASSVADNASVAIVVNHGTASDTTNVIKDTIAPTLSITLAVDIDATNVANYSASGVCSEDGTINLDLGGLTNTATCSAGGWSISSWDVSGLSDGVGIILSADQTDTAGNAAIQVTDTVDKNVISYTVAITSADTINIANVASYVVSGTCSTDTEDVNIDIDGAALTDTVTCSASAFSFTLDASSVADNATLAIAVDHGSASDSLTVMKDTVAPTLTLDAIVNIDSSNVATYTLSGTCDEASATVNINLGGLSNTATCDGALWSIAFWDVSSEADATGINITVDMDDAAGNAAIQATSTVDKDTTAPTIAITSPIDNSYINIANDSASFAISGTCDENGATVDVLIDGISASGQAGLVCDGTNFTGSIDSTVIPEGTYVLSGELSDGVNTGTSSNLNIIRDVTAPTISLDALSNINAANEASFSVTGSCTDNIDSIDIVIGAATASGSCSAGAFNISVDTNSVSDGTGISVSADITDAAGNTGTQASSTVNKDATIPTVTIAFSPDITAANESSYNVSGACSENGETVSVNIDGLTYTPTCSSSAWSLNSIDVSSRADNPSLPITADHTDSFGNLAIQASSTVDKNAATPTVTINSAVNITNANETNYSVSGTCSDNGTIVSLAVDSLTFSPNCSSGVWSMNSIDASSLTDGPITITADHSSAPQASLGITKDSASQTVTISSAPDITVANETNYIASGTCSDNGQNVDVYIDSLNYLLTCNSGSWTTGIVDVSSLTDGSGLIVSADHSSATQATVSINKSTSTPTVSSLSVSATLSESADLNFQLDDPGGYTVSDYIINYRINGSPTWLVYNDGVNLDTTPTITSLSASTDYEFRVAVVYDTSNQSAWSNTASGTTQPDSIIFGPYAAMNVGGSTTTTVVAYEDNTNVTLNGAALVTLSSGQTHVFASTKFDVIDADKPIFTAGRRGSTSAGGGANIVWNPTSWAGKNFSFNATRTSPQILEIYAVEDATVTVKQGSTVLDSATIAADGNATLTWSPYGSYQVISTGTILAYHISAGGSNLHDPTPLLPSHTEIIGFPSNSMRLTTTVDSTNYFFYHSNSVSNSGSLDKQGVFQINPQGTGTQFQGDSLLIQADQKISGASFADSNGLCSSSFIPTNLMRTKYVLPTNSDYIAFASKTAGTIEVRNAAGSLVTTLTLTRSGGNSNAPFKVRMANPQAGYKFTATAPVGAWYQPNNNTGSADQDESLLFGTND